MRPDIHQPTTHTVFPPPPIVRSAEPRRPRVRPRSIAVVAAWAIVAVLLVQQRHEIELLHQRATDTSRALDERFSSLTDSQAALETELEGVFDPSAVVRSALPSVFTLTAGPFQGSAFVLSSDATGSMLVTNYHVVRFSWAAGVRRVVVRAEGRSFNGTVVQVRPGADIAVVEVDASLPSLESERSVIDVGEPIVVVGSPYGFGGSASTGIVSAVRGRFVQFSAPVSPGSSGGPVLAGDGRVVAMTAAKVVGHGAEGLSFAIPIDQVCRQTVAC